MLDATNYADWPTWLKIVGGIPCLSLGLRCSGGSATIDRGKLNAWDTVQPIRRPSLASTSSLSPVRSAHGGKRSTARTRATLRTKTMRGTSWAWTMARRLGAG